METKRVSTKDLQALEASTAQALSIVLGLLAEAAGSEKLAYHLAAALDAARKMQPNQQRDRLLQPAYRLVLLKAAAAAPGNAEIQSLVASLRESKSSH